MNVRKFVWIYRSEALPTERDADAYGCVIARHKHNGMMVTDWRRVRDNELIVAWAKQEWEKCACCSRDYAKRCLVAAIHEELNE